nr:Ig-like domain-containing protein [Gemmatimonadaceae bacterium]
MHMFSRKRALVASSAAALALLAGCGDDVTVPIAIPPAPQIALTPSNATANVGETVLFATNVTAASSQQTTVACATSNTAVATVAFVAGSGCRATAVAPGQATVTATVTATGPGGTQTNSASAQLVVNNLPAAIRSFVATPNNVSMAPGTTNTVQTTVERGGTSVTPTYTVTSAAPAIATAAVNATGQVTISAVAPGQTVVTITASGSATGFATTALTANVNVTVSNAPPSISSLNVSPASLGTIALGSTQRLTSVATQPAGAPAARITYGTSAPTIATVDSTGLVTAVAPGTATITVTATSAGSATFAATTLTQLVSVVVSRPANVTIFDIRQGPIVTDYNSSGLVVSSNSQVDQPVDITN